MRSSVAMKRNLLRAPYGCQQAQRIAFALRNDLCMKTQDKETAARIGQNITFLLNRKGMEVMALAERSGVGLRTVTYMKAGKGNPTIANVSAVARVFGLTSWHLLSKTLEQDYDNQEWLDRIHNAFALANGEGQDFIRRATEIAEKLPAPPPANDEPARKAM